MKYLLTTFAFLFLVGAIQYAAAQELGGARQYLRWEAALTKKGLGTWARV